MHAHYLAAGLLAVFAAPASGESDYLAWVPADTKDALRCSDVIFMKPGTLAQYRDLRADREAWGYRGAFPRQDLGITSSLDVPHIRAAQAMGMKYVASTVAAVHERWKAQPELQAMAGESFDGEALPRSASEYGKPPDARALMGCLNIPEFRRHLLDSARSLVAGLGTDGLQLDDWQLNLGATAVGGCFCPHCLDGFREYLAQHAAPARLKELGVADLKGFDYRDHLKRSAGVRDAQDFIKRFDTLPLAREFADFQYASAHRFYEELAAHVRRLGGERAVVLTTNNGLRTAGWIGVARLFDYLAAEVHYGSRYKTLDERSAYVFKLADSLGLHVAASPWMQDWGFLHLHPRPQMVRAWIAYTYALGHNMMVPHFQTALIPKPEGGFEGGWYVAKDDEYREVYRFVKEHPELFDGCRSLAQVALIYGANDPDTTRVDVLSRELTRRNYPFVAFTSGTDAISLRLNPKQLAGLEIVLPTCPLERLHPDDQRSLAQAGVRVASGLADLPAPVVRAEPGRVLLTLRGDPAKRDTLICHVLNRDYDFETDSLRPADARVRIHERALRGRRVAAVARFGPEGEPSAVTATTEGPEVVLDVPGLRLWSVLRLTLR